LFIDEKVEYENKYAGNDAKILVLATEERFLQCANGLFFSTGNHPAELFVPLLHFDKAGLGIDFATPTGASVKTELWAMPHEGMCKSSISKCDANDFVDFASSMIASHTVSLFSILTRFTWFRRQRFVHSAKVKAKTGQAAQPQGLC
jgi:putative intracellular protease/amidase